MIDYKGYRAVLAFDPEQRLFTGRVVGLRDELLDAHDGALKCVPGGGDMRRHATRRLGVKLRARPDASALRRNGTGRP